MLNIVLFVCNTFCTYIYILCINYSSNVNNAFRTIHKCTKHFKDIPGCLDVATEVKKQIEEFKPFIPLIQGLRNQGMRNRHWEQVCLHTQRCICMRACVCVTCVHICKCIIPVFNSVYVVCLCV